MDRKEILQEIQKYGLTEEQFVESLQYISNAVNNKQPINWKNVKNKFSIPLHFDSLRKASQTLYGGAFVAEYYKTKEKEDNDQTIEQAKAKYGNETAINKDGSRTSDKLLEMSEEQSKDVNYMLTAHGFDTKAWELVSARNNIWNVYSKQDGINTLYSSKITVKPRVDISLEEIEDFYKYLSTTYETPKRKIGVVYNSGIMLEVPIFDLHLGKFSMSEDVVDGYDYQTARGNFNYIIDDVISQVGNQKIEQIIFPVGQDFFQVDNTESSTTSLTRQDTDLSWKQMFLKGIELLVDGINKLSEIAPVKVMCVNGNHDFMTSYHAVVCLYHHYINDDRVIVDTGTSPRKYVEYGNCLIGYSHGDKERNKIDGIMQVEAREAWGKTLFHEWHLGHLHSEQTIEKNGIIIRNLSSVTGTDQWHHTSGYVGAIRKCQCFLWDKEYGLKTIFNIVIK